MLASLGSLDGAAREDRGQLGDRAGSRAPARPQRARHGTPLGEPRRLAPRHRRRCGSRPRPVAPGCARRDSRRLPDRHPDARVGRSDRDRCPRARDGSPPRAARPARLLPSDRDERAARARLVGLRAPDHRHRGGRALRRALRLSCAVAVDARLRRIRACAGAPGADRLRAEVRPQNRDLGGSVRARLLDVVGSSSRAI